MSQTFNSASLPADIADFTLIQALHAVRAKTIAPEDLVRAVMLRYEKFVGFNAFICANFEAALEEAKEFIKRPLADAGAKRLFGIPIAVKDNLHVAGLPNTAGTASLAQFIPQQDCWVVKRLRGEGALLVGKTNMHELSLGVTSQNARFGDVRNALDEKRLAGGSSGGSAVAVALGLAYGAIGTDTAGSIRIPAALNSIVGLRPTIGRYARDGVTPVCPTRDTPGPMGRTVSDVAWLDNAIMDSERPLDDIGADQIRLGVVRDYFFDGVDAQISAMTSEALRRLRSAGVQVVELSMPGLNDLNDMVGTAIGFGEFWKSMTCYLRDNRIDVSCAELARAVASDDVRCLIDNFIQPGAEHEIAADVYADAVRIHRPALRQMFANVFSSNGLDGIVFPTTLAAAGELSRTDGLVELDNWQISANYAYLRNTLPASNAGLPGLTVPMGFTSQGQAVGLEIDGPDDSDRRLLAVGCVIESIISNMSA
ncbi:amidase family protein [Paraburkholderia phenoliruptrix]|uniref:amidase family protein n=1 Tax=Paraburkholderia phenoliruptrix TaxID=252970 RepID=UPI0034CD77D2